MKKNRFRWKMLCCFAIVLMVASLFCGCEKIENPFEKIGQLDQEVKNPTYIIFERTSEAEA